MPAYIANTYNTSVDSIRIHANGKSLKKTIIIQFKADMVRKQLKCPRYMQQDWCQIVVTPREWLRVLRPHNKVRCEYSGMP